MNDAFAKTNAPAVLRLLGTPASESDSLCPHRLGQKPLVLFARLLLEARPVSREAMMTFLWPEVSEARARGSLRQALHVLREAVGEQLLRTDRRAITVLVPPPVDLLEFQRAMRQGQYSEAALWYGGRLLDGVTISDATDADLWLDLERRRLQRLFETAAEAALRNPLAFPSLEDRLQVARRFRDVAPRATRAWRYLFEGLVTARLWDALLIEQAALGALLDTGRVDNPEAAAMLLQQAGTPMSVGL